MFCPVFIDELVIIFVKVHISLVLSIIQPLEIKYRTVHVHVLVEMHSMRFKSILLCRCKNESTGEQTSLQKSQPTTNNKVASQH